MDLLELVNNKIKRKRSVNWVTKDKLLLKRLVNERLDDIENKDCHTESNHRKQQAWIQIQEEFNRLALNSPRTISQLRTQWVAMKVMARKSCTFKRDQQIAEIARKELRSWLENDYVPESSESNSESFIMEGFESEINKELLGEQPQKVTKIRESSPTEHIIMEFETELKKEFDEDIPLETEEFEPELPKEVLVNDTLSSIPSQTIKNNSNTLPQDNDTKRKKKKLLKRKPNLEESVKAFAAFEIKTRKELLLIQMANERKKSLNYDLEKELLRTKILYYKHKMKESDNAAGKTNGRK